MKTLGSFVLVVVPVFIPLLPRRVLAQDSEGGSPTVSTIRPGALGVRFLLEVSALGALAHWGFGAGEGGLERWSLGIGAPLAAAVVWGTFVSPKAPVPVSPPVRIGIEAAVFGAATAALAAAGDPGRAAVFGLTALVNGAVVHAWGR